MNVIVRDTILKPHFKDEKHESPAFEDLVQLTRLEMELRASTPSGGERTEAGVDKTE